MEQQRRLVFLDASVLIAGSHSASGGSALAIRVCQGGKYRAAVSRLVVLEARVNIAEKLGQEDLLNLYRHLAALQPHIVPPPAAARLAECALLVGQKDAHVLAAALECAASYLLTLDKHHLACPSAQLAGLPVKVITPGEFLRELAGIA